jgi:AcrR family transcriptional regulator
MYLFGSKEGLLTEVFSIARERQLELITAATGIDGTPVAAVRRLWESWLADPGRAGLMRLFFDNYIRSIQGATAYGDFATESVSQWLEFLRPLTTATADPEGEATLLLAVLRGLLLDQLATGDYDRVNRALSAYLKQFPEHGPGE